MRFSLNGKGVHVWSIWEIDSPRFSACLLFITSIGNRLICIRQHIVLDISCPVNRCLHQVLDSSLLVIMLVFYVTRRR